MLGTRPAGRKNISKILNRGDCCAIIPGGIAEMFLVNTKTEEIYLKTRRNTIKAAIQEGANIFPVFFFGNTKLFTIAGQSGSDSFLSKLSRKFRTSTLFFYGRHYLPVPKRQHLHLVSGEVIIVKQNDNPTEQDIDLVMNQVVKAVEFIYQTKKPTWEDRPLVIT